MGIDDYVFTILGIITIVIGTVGVYMLDRIYNAIRRGRW